MVKGMKLWTVERPWLGNQPSVSCIPAGCYACQPRQFHRKNYPAIQVCDVEGRSYILIHRANVASELEGCIAVGMGRGFYKGAWSITSSKSAHDFLMKHYGGVNFSLKITNPEALKP